MNGMATALSTALYRDGQAAPTADISWGGFRLTNLADPTADTDAMNQRTADSRYGSSTAVRLTLTSGVAVTESDITGAGTVYLTPDGSNNIGIYDGSAWVARTMVECSLSLDATGHLASTNYDIYAFWTGSVVSIGTSPAWASATTRGVGAGTNEIEFYQGRLVNKYSMTLRNAGVTITTVPARKGVLVGGIRITTVAGQTEDSFARRFLSNVYGRTERQMKRMETAASWTYAASAYRQANGNTANKMEWFSCVGGDRVEGKVHVVGKNSTSTPRTSIVTISLDTITTNNATFSAVLSINDLSNVHHAEYAGYPGIGSHYLAWLEYTGTNDVRTFYGDGQLLIPATDHTGGMIGTVIG